MIVCIIRIAAHIVTKITKYNHHIELQALQQGFNLFKQAILLSKKSAVSDAFDTDCMGSSVVLVDSSIFSSTSVRPSVYEKAVMDDIIDNITTTDIINANGL